MMKTDITVVLDRSGSMESIAGDVIGGLNTFVRAQAQVEGEACFTLVQFDDHYEVVHAHVPVQDVPPLTDQTYVPRGSTALLDAIGRTIVATGARLAMMAEADRPQVVIFAVQTDGLENASREFTRQQVFDMIRTRRPTTPGSSCSWPRTRMRSPRATRWGSQLRQRWTTTRTAVACRRSTASCP